MRAYILSIGSELLLGHLTDTNATYLAQDLAAHGIELLHVTQVGDDQARIAATIQHALKLADILVCTGGIGPTDDDLTREAIGDVLGELPKVDATLLQEIKAFFSRRGLSMPERNAKQAWLIPSAEPLPNPVGTAPGWFVRIRGSEKQAIVAMPGVPREMHRMWREQVLPRILPLAGTDIIDTTTLKTIGIGESAAEESIHDLVAAKYPVVATYAKDDGVHIRITSIGRDVNEVRLHRDRAVSTIRKRLGAYIWGEDDETLADTLLRRLSASGERLAVVEVGTGGAFTAMLSSSPNTSGVLLGSTILPSGVAPDGNAEQLAAHAAESGSASLSMAIKLVTQPDSAGRVEGQATVAIARGEAVRTASPLPIRSGLPDAQRRAALHAADALRRYLNDQSL